LARSLGAYPKGSRGGMGGGGGVAEDWVRERLTAFRSRRHTYDPAQPLTPWVFAIARYRLIDYLRQTRASLADVPLDDAGELLAQNDHVEAESTYDLHKLLSRLPEKMRRAIQYVKLEGLSTAEAAKRCGVSEAAIKVNVHRG